MKFLFLPLALATALLPTCSKKNSDSIPQVDNVVSSFMSTYSVPGMSIAITKDGKLIYAKSYCKADKEAGAED
jgi:CubicO group peptidase (beta-lactamase class C family)